MKIILSPAKKMETNTDLLPYKDLPEFLSEAEVLMNRIKILSYPEAKALWACNDKLAELNFQRFQHMDLHKNLTPALISYEGIQYQYMAPRVFSERELEYVQEHVRILSGFYGILRPLDGVTPYRLEMQAKWQLLPDKSSLPRENGHSSSSLYDFWGSKLYRSLSDPDRTILNLASKEYSKAVEAYLQPEDLFITFVFGEWKDGKIVQKGTQAKMARGEMVRYLAEHQIKEPQAAKNYSRLGYQFQEELSSPDKYVFLKQVNQHG